MKYIISCCMDSYVMAIFLENYISFVYFLMVGMD